MKKSPGGDAPRDDASALVNAFLASATSEFAELVATPGARWSVAVEHSTGSGMVTVAPERITGFFVATGAFANSLVAGEITFGDREYYVNTVLGPASGSAQYGLWEWADAIGKPDLVPRQTAFVSTVQRLETIVASMAHAVTCLQEVIAQPQPGIIAQMELARESVQADFQSRERDDEHRRVGAAAAEAFRKREYRRVVALLEPLVDLLTPAEREKLTYARRHL